MNLGVRSVYTSWVLVVMIAAVVMMAAPGSAVPVGGLLGRFDELMKRPGFAKMKSTELREAREELDRAVTEGESPKACEKFLEALLAYFVDHSREGEEDLKLLKTAFSAQPCVKLLKSIEKADYVKEQWLGLRIAPAFENAQIQRAEQMWFEDIRQHAEAREDTKELAKIFAEACNNSQSVGSSPLSKPWRNGGSPSSHRRHGCSLNGNTSSEMSHSNGWSKFKRASHLA